MKNLLEWVNKNKYEIAWGSIELLKEIKIEMIKLGETGAVHQFLTNFLIKRDYLEGIKLQNLKSIFAVAIPCKEQGLIFNFNDKRYKILISPGYVNRKLIDTKIFNELSNILNGNIEQISLIPIKNLSVKLGLTAYGRNNITYIPNLGSYFSLLCFVSNFDFGCKFSSVKIENTSLNNCENCYKCVKACPTGAFSKENSVVNFDQCICRFSVMKEKFPEWINPKWYNRLFGCMICQKVCPENAQFNKSRIEVICEFTSEETVQLLDGYNPMTAPDSDKLKKKIFSLGLSFYYGINISEYIGRNLKALLYQI